jgi:drug/metabolite transporter (DMT)-like permease
VTGRLRYTLLAFVFTTLWASAFVVVKVALRWSPPLFLMATRFLVAGVLMLAWARATGRPLPRGAAGWLPAVVLGLLNQGLYLGLTALSLQYISAGMGAVLASTNPLMLALVAPWALGERLGPVKVAGLLVSYAGVAGVMWSRLGEDNRPLGMALALLSVACIVAGTVVFKRLRGSHDLLVLNGGQVLASGLALIGPSLLWEDLGRVRPGPGFFLTQAYLILAMSVGAMLIWFWLLREGDATRASAWFFLSPVLGLFFGAALLGEPLGLHDFAGAAAVALGIWLVQRA